MIKYIFLILILFNHSASAIRAVIRVLEAPIHRNPNEKSSILQNKRMGEIIHLHETTFEDKNFYQTLTRSGSDGYIRKDFVKVIFNDERELSTNIRYKNDPTDYVLNEPLYEDYPFSDKRENKASFSAIYGLGLPNHYNYNGSIQRESVGPSIGLTLNYLKRTDFNLEDRLYYGVRVNGSTSQNEYALENNIFSEEIHNTFGAGPEIRYTIVKYENFEMDLNLSFSINYMKLIVSQKNFSISPSEFEELIFSGISISNTLGVTFTHKNLLNNRDIQFVHGPIISSTLPYSLKTSTQPELTSLWTSTEYSSGLTSMFTYVAGFTYRY